MEHSMRFEVQFPPFELLFPIEAWLPESPSTATASDENEESESENELMKDETLNKTPLFKQFLKLSLKRSASRKAPEQPPPETPLDKARKILQPKPEIINSNPNFLGFCSVFEPIEPFSDLIELMKNIKEWLCSDDLDTVRVGAHTIYLLLHLDISKQDIGLITADLLNPIAEVCAKLLTVEKYSKMYYGFISGIFYPIFVLNDTSVFEKYNVERRLLKLISTTNDIDFYRNAVALTCRMFLQCGNDQYFFKVLIAIMPDIDTLTQLGRSITISLAELFVKNNVDSGSFLMMDLHNQVKNKGNEFDLLRVYLCMWRLKNHYKTCKSWFQLREFNLLCTFIRLDFVGYRHFLIFLSDIVSSAPEKVFDNISIAQLCDDLANHNNFLDPEWTENQASFILTMFYRLFPQEDPTPAGLNPDGPKFQRSDEPQFPKVVPNAILVFMYFLDTILKLLDKPFVPSSPAAYNAALSSVYTYMMENHGTNMAAIHKNAKVFEKLTAILKNKPFDVDRLLEILRFSSFIAAQNVTKEFYDSGLYDAIEAAMKTKVDELTGVDGTDSLFQLAALESHFAMLKSTLLDKPFEEVFIQTVKNKMKDCEGFLPPQLVDLIGKL